VEEVVVVVVDAGVLLESSHQQSGNQCAEQNDGGDSGRD